MHDLSPKAEALLLQQRTQYGGLSPSEIAAAYDRDIADYAEALRPHLPARSGELRFIDIGCGLGFSLLGLAKIYGPEARYVGVDRGEVTQNIVYGFSETPSAYNSLEITGDLLRAAGIPAANIELVDVERAPFPDGPADIVTSILAWGFHFPLSVYLAKVTAALRPGGVLVVDVRRGLDQQRAVESDYRLLASFPMAKSDRLVLQRLGDGAASKGAD